MSQFWEGKKDAKSSKFNVLDVEKYAYVHKHIKNICVVYMF